MTEGMTSTLSYVFFILPFWFSPDLYGFIDWWYVCTLSWGGGGGGGNTGEGSRQSHSQESASKVELVGLA